MYKQLLISFLFLVFLAGCHKENDSELPQKGFRIKSWHDSVNYNQSCEIIYDGNKVKEVHVFYGTGHHMETYNTWIYEGNTITINVFNYNSQSDRWIKEDRKMVLTLNEKGQLVEQRLFDDDQTYIFTYTWDGDKVISQQLQSMYADIVTNYSYENELLTQINNGKQVLEYEDGRVSKITAYGSDTATTTFYYPQGLLSETIHTGLPYLKKQVFNYDSNKNLSGIIYYQESEYIGEFVNPLTVTYEPGEGNLDLYWMATRGWISVYLYPNMLPQYCILVGFQLSR